MPRLSLTNISFEVGKSTMRVPQPRLVPLAKDCLRSAHSRAMTVGNRGGCGFFPVSPIPARRLFSSQSSGVDDSDVGADADAGGLPTVDGKGPPPEEPPAGLCCMSGCANCVYLEHAKELMAYYADGGAKAVESLNQIKDPTMKAFLKFEFQTLKRS